MNDAMLWWGLGLIAIGVLLMLAEVFIPSGGILGLTAGVCAIAGIVVLFVHDTVWGVTGLLSVAVLGPVTVGWGLRILPHTPIGRKVMGGEMEDLVESHQARVRREVDQRRALVGAEGIAVTEMHPVGEIRVDGETHEAVAESAWIDEGAAVRIVHADGFEIRVVPAG